MGILNTTPDSFSDGGLYVLQERALEHAQTMLAAGADIIDVGGESTRPGAKEVGEQEELERVLPVVEALVREFDAPISIDTTKTGVMSAALNAGAQMINDVNALRAEGAVETVAQYAPHVCLMHMQGQPRTMQTAPRYQNVVGEVIEFLQARIAACVDAGMRKDLLLVDPGIGFGKSLQHNLALLRATPEIIAQTGCAGLIGVSRKSLIDGILQRSVEQRIFGSVGLAVQAAMQGAKIVRVHDVAETHDAIRCVEAVAAVNPD